MVDMVTKLSDNFESAFAPMYAKHSNPSNLRASLACRLQ